MPSADAASLTRWEWRGLASKHNLADGHAHHLPSPEEAAVFRDLPQIFAEAAATDQRTLQDQFADTFFSVNHQDAALTLNPPLFHYSSSISIEVVANYLRLENSRCLLLEPTFDNIPAILRRHGIPLGGFDEADLASPNDLDLSSYEALFVVLPNNPTGFELTPASFATLADSCAASRTLLIVDASFRHFSLYHDTDSYSLLLDSGTEFIVIEDTGKTLPSLDVKLGFLVSSAGCYESLRSITDDFLLNVSPMIFVLLGRLYSTYLTLDPTALPRSIARANRQVLQNILSGTPIVFSGVSDQISVEWLKTPWSCHEVCEWLHRSGVAVLPGTPFFWSEPDRGTRFVRVALLRDLQHFAAGMSVLEASITAFARRRPSKMSVEPRT